MLNNFLLVRLKLELVAEETLILPQYKGSTIRGGFGHALKKVCCLIKDTQCVSCLLKEKCVYSYCFETPLPADVAMMRKYPYAPHPFVIEPPLERKGSYRPGEALNFGLILIGRAIDYLPYFIYTFEELGRIGLGKGRGRCRLARVLGLDAEGNEKEIYDGQSRKVMNRFPIIRAEDISCPSSSLLTLNFPTPTRLRYEGHLTDELEFHVLIRNLLRRLSALSYFHCGQELKIDFKAIIERAKAVEINSQNLRWYDWERYSQRQNEKMKLGGILGTITYQGLLAEFYPYLMLGQWLHVGKGTSFGLGKYEIKEA